MYPAAWVGSSPFSSMEGKKVSRYHLKKTHRACDDECDHQKRRKGCPTSIYVLFRTVDASEILYQVRLGVYPINYMVSTPPGG